MGNFMVADADLLHFGVNTLVHKNKSKSDGHILVYNLNDCTSFVLGLFFMGRRE